MIRDKRPDGAKAIPDPGGPGDTARMLRRAAACLVLAAAIGGANGGDEPEIDPGRHGTWADAVGCLDPRWRVPDVRTDETLPEARRPADLLRRMREAIAARPGAADPRFRSFAGAVQAVRSSPDPDAVLAALRADDAAWRAFGPEISQLCRERVLVGSSWNPAKDGDEDGILTGAAFRGDGEKKEPWTRIDGGRPMLQQAAALLFADLDAVKEAENDYTAYPKHVGASYERIHGVKGSYVRGKDASARAFTASRMFFEQDLPFPYSTYSCDLRIVNRVGGDGNLVCDIWSPSKDFDFMAGQDVFLPVRDPSGAFVALCCVRVFGFDLDSVPDGEDDVRAALRSSLGNLKRRSDALFAARTAAGGKPRTIDGSVPPFVVRGVK
ncbi:MAG: hypothetical protein HMLKMBBP_01388 [Planctomycetes bacterium]|nr:hypothetical protein [Planctomycetota bacterium]